MIYVLYNFIDSKQSNDFLDIFGSTTSSKTSSNVKDKDNLNKKRNINDNNDSDEDDSNTNSSSSNDDDDDDNRNYNFEKEDEINCFRNRMQIKIKGSNIPKPCVTFTSMDIDKDLKHIILKNIESSLWKEPTPIQMQGIPCLLQGRDILATAPTGI